ncbi:MAG: exodeoxyribonuclease VII large subunit [Ignavibacteriaceae bacterium]
MILTVSELTQEIKISLEEKFSQVSVVGEISGFKSHVSGHWYFNLKDANAVISCTMWKGFNNYVFFTPQDGRKVIINGRITVYPPRGNYQIDVKSMKPAGVGELQAAFEALKQKLAAEGLFDENLKKEIPFIPGKIGIVTAIDGAALRDMISVAGRRFPLAELVIAPARVQGSGAAPEIVDGIKQLNKYKDIDVIIVARGGGSIEDLWAFNEEIVARAIVNSNIPVVSGVGHEVDFTIADFAADLRAPTPSAAMEIVTPSKEDFNSFINEFIDSSYKEINDIIEKLRANVYNRLNSYGFRMPLDLVRRKSQQVDNLIYKLLKNIEKKSLAYKGKLSILVKSIEVHDVNRQLKKGFVLVKQDSRYITRKSSFSEEKDTILKFYDDELRLKKRD